MARPRPRPVPQGHHRPGPRPSLPEEDPSPRARPFDKATEVKMTAQQLADICNILVRAHTLSCLTYHQFGMYSKNFSFSPGFGMPGRVFLSKIPSWENNLSLRKPEQFARVGGAKIYGVNTSLCLPIFTPIGTMVVAMYSTQNLARDMTWEKK
eukprot:CAMPEP_0172527674 /NCGR_PEP_ID=MMETSP1067-20121228/2308_1 /TAXON_ID=265564 ORGANISM="Thalassiosira punctigera, Strain Tpunct2005C2" /NCGR_SAMPLE_ID=MMETSP1067 /ASSEMBLY_ACC=CAM_ASM_000444 /LENGTH=152 /DNA_ID=CAMNT_0013311463 /DNA_START=358 /DNA_END=813 /DNA_ORIENTATION=-